MHNIQADLEIWQEGDLFVGYIPRLEVTSCGATFAEAKKNTLEALEIFIKETKRKGTFSELMEEAGFEENAGSWHPKSSTLEELTLAVA